MIVYLIETKSTYFVDKYISKSPLAIIRSLESSAEFFGRKNVELPMLRKLKNMADGEQITTMQETSDGTGKIYYYITCINREEM